METPKFSPGMTRIAAAAIIALGVAAAGFFAGSSLVESRLGFRTVLVKGAAEKEVKADLGFWPMRFVATGATLEDARQQLGVSEAAVKAFLGAQGFPETSYSVQSIRVEDKFANSYGGGVMEGARFVLTQDMLVRTSEVDKLATASRNVGDLLRAGVVFASDGYSDGPSYQFTRINDLKGELLTEATQRAREAAQQFARESGARVGGIQSASQGVIDISGAVDIPNSNPDRQIDKKVRVVSTITYFLKGG
jgi:uncharacterized protein